MMFRSALFFALTTSAVLAACAVPGRGDSVDDDDGTSEDFNQITTTGAGNGSGSGSGGSGGATSSNSVTSSTSGPSASSTGSGGTCTPANIIFNDATCGACVESSCCPTLTACDNSLDCTDYLGCVTECLDQFCVDDCDAFYPTGSAQMSSLNTCIDNSCPIDCPTG